jgi:hypothetical protein
MIRFVVAAVAVIACSKSATERATDPPPRQPDPAVAVKKPSLDHPAERHRESASPCERATVPPNPSYQGCKSDTECTEPGSRCTVAHRVGNSVPANTCVKDACVADKDCGAGPGGVCECASYGNYCVRGDCRTDGDCGTGGACSISYGCRGAIDGYFCHKSADTCVNDQDCKSDGGGWTSCRFSAEVGHWACVTLQCPVG